MTLRPVKGKPIGEYLSDLMEIQNQIAGTPEEISEVACKTHIFTLLPPIFNMTLKIQQNRADAMVESIIDALKEDERIRTMRTAPDATSEAFHGDELGTRRGSRGRSRGGRGRARAGGNIWCSFCNSRTHTPEACWSKNRTTPGSGNSGDSAAASTDKDTLCWHCGESGHRQSGCPVKRHGDEARAGGRKRQKIEKAEAQLADRESGPGF